MTAPRLLYRHFHIWYLCCSGLPQSSLPRSHPGESPTVRAFYSGESGLLRSVIRLVRPVSVSLSLTSFSKDPASLPQQVPSATRGHNPSQTTIISVCVDSFIQVMQDEQCARSISPSHAHGSHQWLVTTPAARVLAGSASRSGYLNLAVRWSPHLFPIVRTSH